MELRHPVATALTDTLGRDESFEQAWQRAMPVEGWMTREQGALLWTAASAVPTDDHAPLIVEIGSYRGRSMSILGAAAPAAARLVAIDPHAGNDRGPQQWEGTPDEGQADHEAFWSNLRDAGVADRVEHVRAFSQDAHDQVSGPIDLLYIDGAHGYRPALDDLVRWGARVRDGGVMLVHDCYSSVGVTLALLRSMTTSGDWEYLGRTRSMGAWRRRPVAGRARVRNSARQLAPMGWFARNLVVKAAIVTRLRPVARLFGSDGTTWPY